MNLKAWQSKESSKGGSIRARMLRWGIFVGLGIVSGTVLLGAEGDGGKDWPMFGRTVSNDASSQSEGITAGNASKLHTKWTFATSGDVTARAAVVDGVAYFPDWGGNIWAVDANTGAKLWGHQLSEYGLTAGTLSRTSPAVVNGMVYIGTQFTATGKTGWLLALKASTGALVWKTQPDTSNPFPVVTGSPAVADGVVYIGMTSNEEFAAASPAYKCCSVSGSVVALNAATGARLWETFMVPSGYSGGAVWGSSPVVDEDRRMVVVGTGNNYSVPTAPAYLACVAGGGTRATCQSPDNHADSIVALDMDSGHIRWAKRLETWGQTGITDGSDDWNVACIAHSSNCPPAQGPDYDFGSGPNEITYHAKGGEKAIIGAGQKSGIYYALDPEDGTELWHTQVGPGSSLGGIEWGSASDGTRIYVAIGNLFGIPYAAGNAGSFAALDPATGAILWQKADPNGGMDIGPMTVASGVVYAPSMGGPHSATAPTMLALDASSGNTLWSFAAGASVNAGATVVHGTVFWGSGYAHLGALGTGGNNTFYAFSGPGGDD